MIRTGRRRWQAAATAGALCLLTAPLIQVSSAAADTVCSFGGPTPGFHVARLDLPKGSSFLDLRITVTPPERVVGDRASWHLAQGIAVINARTGELLAAKVGNWGVAARRAVVRVAGRDVVDQDLVSPEAPFQHVAGTPVPYLGPGSYFAVGFGVDGDRQLPNPLWGVELRASGAVHCTPVGAGETFDLDHTEFTGGSQISSYGPGLFAGLNATLTTKRRWVFGLMDSHTQLAGSASMTYRLPSSQGSLRNEIVPFVTRGGTMKFTADGAGPFPMIDVAGVTFTA